MISKTLGIISCIILGLFVYGWYKLCEKKEDGRMPYGGPL
jgi:hypothetical protein